MTLAKRMIEAVAMLLLGALVVVPFIQVILRGVFGAPIVGAEEFTRFLLIFVVFFSFPLVVLAGENIIMADLRDALPERPRRALILLSKLGAIFVTAVIAYAVFTTIGDNLKNATPTLKIPFWLFLGATLFGFLVALIMHLIQLRDPPKDGGSVIL